MKNAKILKGIQADEEILKFFRPNEKPFIYKLLKFLRMNGDVITWDDDTLEVNINGQDYLGSSKVDILSYLTDKNLGGYDNLFQKLGFDMKKAHRLGQIKRKKQIGNTKVFNTKAKKYITKMI